MKAIVNLVLVVVIATAGAAALSALVSTRSEVVLTPPEERPLLVEVLQVEPSPVELFAEVFGSVEPGREARLSAEVAGRVAQLAPAAIAGGRVSQGDALVELDRADLEVALVAAEARLEEARAALVREQAEADQALRELQHAGVEDAGPLARREPQVAVARAAVAAAEAQRRRAQLDLERTVLRAPFDALVTAERVELGQVVAPGMSLLDLVSIEAFEVRLPLVDRERALLAPLHVGEIAGPPVLLEVESAGRRVERQARVVRTLPGLDPQSRALVAIARVDQPLRDDAVLRLGDFVRARIRGRRIEQAFLLPEVALRPGDEVWLADDEDRLVRRVVEIAQRRDGLVIVERGLAPGERVIVSALESAPEGRLLEVRAADEDGAR
jgi:RND family efflux transporter MFP subunit